jgi:hypothetical protein
MLLPEWSRQYAMVGLSSCDTFASGTKISLAAETESPGVGPPEMT